MKQTAACPKPSKKPFIVREIDSDMMRANPVLPNGARMLWMSMLAMANAKTLELRYKTHWFSGEEIDRRAGISDETRKKYMRILQDVGLIRWEQERVIRVVKDPLSGRYRKRSVKGATHYYIAKYPRKDWLSSAAKKTPRRRNVPFTTVNATCSPKREAENAKYSHKDSLSSTAKNFSILKQPNSSAAQEFGPQFLSELHQEGVSVVHGVDNSQTKVQQGGEEASSSNHHKTDDDALLPYSLSDWKPFEEALAVRKNLVKTHRELYRELKLEVLDDRWFVIAMGHIESRSTGKISSPVQYFTKSLVNLFENVTAQTMSDSDEVLLDCINADYERHRDGELDSNVLEDADFDFNAIFGLHEQTPEFEQFFHSYPNKCDERKAYQAWCSIPNADEILGEILAGLENWKSSERWWDERFIPSAAKFLRDERWKKKPL